MMMVPGVMKMIIGVVYNQTKIKKNVKKKKKKKLNPFNLNIQFFFNYIYILSHKFNI